MKKVVIALVLLVLAGGGYYYYRARAAQADAAPEFTTTTIAKGDIVQLVTATGTLDAVLSVDVGSQISGQIKALYADFNTKVQQGQKLVELDPATYQQKVRQAEADLASAEASYTLAELNSKRTQELFQKSLVTAQDNDQTQAQLKQAKSTLMTRQAALENSKVDLSRCTIFSPIDGVIISKQTEVGKTVAASMNVPVLFTIANDLAKMQITAAVAEADIGSVSENQQATFTVDAFPNRTFRGVVTQVRNAPKNTSNVVTYDTIISVDNRDLKLRPGMTANVSIIVAHRDGVVRIPNSALRVRIPDGVNVIGAAAPQSGAAKTPAQGAASGPQGGNNSGGQRRGGGFGADASPEQREKFRAIMAEVGITSMRDATQEQRDQFRKLLVERGVITAEQAQAMAERGGGNRSGGGDQPAYVTRTVYRFPGGNKLGSPEAVAIKVGITDGIASEVSEGLNEGDVVITSVSVPGAATSAQPQRQNNPFGGGFRRGG